MEPAGNPNPLREWPRLGDRGEHGLIPSISAIFSQYETMVMLHKEVRRNLIMADYMANGLIRFTATYGVPGILRTLTKNAYFGNQPPPRLDSITFCRDVQRMAFREFATCSSGH